MTVVYCSAYKLVYHYAAAYLLPGRHLDAGQLLGVSAADRLQLRLKQEHGE